VRMLREAGALEVHVRISSPPVKQAVQRVPRRCFTGEYPVELPDESLLGKHLLEATLKSPTMGRALPVLNNP
jgi:amidophosphoribosyltransferase